VARWRSTGTTPRYSPYTKIALCGSVGFIDPKIKARLTVKHAAPPRRSVFAGFRFPAELILVAVRW
jgi:hypothetical protein